MNPIGPLKNYLELCRRLGIRYLSALPQDSLEGKSVRTNSLDPVSVAVQETPIRKEIPSTPEIVATSTSWLTVDPDCVEAMELRAFDADIHDCKNCPLGATRKRFVFGSGNPKAEVMFVGEAPGGEEDLQGLPFVGPAGQLLTKIIESTKTWKRPEVFICNVLKCRPPGNRAPLPLEVEQCRPYLEEQIRIIKPKLIMALGASAAQALLNTKDPVGKLRNGWHDYSGVCLKVTYHPSYLLREPGKKKDVWADMQEFTAKFTGIKGLSKGLSE